MSRQPDSYSVVGAGIFGASTALHLIRRYPEARVRLFDRYAAPCKLAASWDWNKVVRADYTDAFSMKLALEAKTAWATDPIFRDFYHQDGMFWLSDTTLARTVVDLYRDLDALEDCDLVTVADARTAYNGLFEDADYRGVSEVLLNKSSGWAEAKEALTSAIKAAVEAGVEYVESDITSVKLSDDKALCEGIISKSGQIYLATHTILCTGAGTATLLANSAPDHQPLHVGNRMVAAAICTGLAKLSPDDLAVFANSPVCCQDVLPGRGGNLPPTSRGELKFWRDVTFRNSLMHASGELISTPDYEQPLSQMMKDELQEVKTAIYGKKAKHLVLENYRICWDAITPDENFIISPHSQCKGLYIATAGSFHGWKFLPTIGKYVVRMLEDKLTAEMSNAWAWDRDLVQEPEGEMWPQREMTDLLTVAQKAVPQRGTKCAVM